MNYSIDSFPGRELHISGKRFLYFGGTSYLGLQTDPNFQNMFIENVKRYGTNYGASRKANVQISIYEKVEAYLAGIAGSESCISMSSGYLAGQLVAQNLHTSGYHLFYAPESHSAVHYRQKKRYASFSALNDDIRAHLKTKKSIPVVFMDSIDVMGTGYPDFSGIRMLPLQHIILVVDDSHGIGIIGENGCGAYKKALQLGTKELIVCCSLGKGFGIQAGAILGTKKRIAQFTKTEFFGGASPAHPAALATLMDGNMIVEEKRSLLATNIHLFMNSIKNTENWYFSKNYPAFHFFNSKIAYFLEKKNILITNFNYPNEDSPLMSRIVLSASHTPSDIDKLTTSLNSFGYD
ncbi:MAG: 8-amino-7-oxononanoate synthase [Maribacter sp.]